MLELVHWHARLCAAPNPNLHVHPNPNPNELWLVPEIASFARSSPADASFERCLESCDLLLVADGSAPASVITTRINPATISSGWRSNDDLLLYEGWTDERLASDRFELPSEALRGAAARVLEEELGMEVDKQAQQVQNAVLEAVRELRQLPEAGYGEVLAGGYASDSLTCSVRALALCGHSVGEYGGVSGCAASIAEGASLSREHDRRAGQILVRVCGDLLEKFPTSEREDEALLEEMLLNDSDQLSDYRRIQCIRSRLSRKRCLGECLERARAGI